MAKDECLELIRKLIKEETRNNPNKVIIRYDSVGTFRYVIYTHDKKVAIPRNLFDTWGEWTSREQVINLLRKL